MRRRSPRVAWLPPTNANSVDALGESNWNTFDIDVGQFALGERTVAEVPIVLDGDKDPLAATTSIADVENSGYRLRRIVGKIFFLLNPQADESFATTIGVTAGLIVRRIDPSTNASIAIAALGSTDLIDPAGQRSAGDPWIWHRNWILQDVNFPFSPSPDWVLSGAAAATNFAHGPAAVDGPHVDQKTARIVSSEERLFLDVSATVLSLTAGDLATKLLRCFYTFRTLGSMRTTSGNRRNASR